MCPVVPGLASNLIKMCNWGKLEGQLELCLAILQALEPFKAM